MLRRPAWYFAPARDQPARPHPVENEVISRVLEGTHLLVDERQPSHVRGTTQTGSIAAYSAPYPDATWPNQDCALIAPMPWGTVLAVADGLGGAPSGHEASKIAVTELARSLSEQDTELEARGAILDAFESGNRAICDLAVGAATTLAVVEIRGRSFRPYHAGDSSILVCGSRGKSKFVSVPHSPVGYAVEAGLIDADEALHHEELNLVSNVLGSSAMRIELGAAFELAERDTVVLATDGLFDNVHQDEIVEIVRSGPLNAAADALAKLATERMHTPDSNKPSKPDDLTFVLYRGVA